MTAHIAHSRDLEIVRSALDLLLLLLEPGQDWKDLAGRFLDEERASDTRQCRLAIISDDHVGTRIASEDGVQTGY